MLALLPILVRGNVPGQEIEYPMAAVIVGGLLTSSVLNLFFLPALFSRFGRTVPTREALP
jgi:Cu/Ag efflux pump CusA